MIPALALSDLSLNVASSSPATILQGSSIRIVTPTWRDDEGTPFTNATKVRFGFYEPNALPVWLTTGIEAVANGGFQITHQFNAPGEWVVFAEYSDGDLIRTVERTLTVRGSVMLGGAEASDGGTPTVWLDAKAAQEARIGAEAALERIEEIAAGVGTGGTGGGSTTPDATLLDRANHTGTQSADTITDGTTNKVYTATEKTKLAGIAAGATVNSTDAQLRARASHTGTQSADTITDGTNNKVLTVALATKLAGIATAATANATDAALRDRSTHTGTQPSTSISDFAEAVQDTVAAMLAAGSGVTVAYDDTAGTLTLTSTATGGTTDPEVVRDTIGVALVGVGLLSVVVNDAGDSITISTTATANSTDAALRDRSTHTGTQTADTVTDGTTNKAFTSTEKTKLAGIATAATANATNAQLRDRSTHTGTQPVSSISGLTTAIQDAVAAATAPLLQQIADLDAAVPKPTLAALTLTPATPQIVSGTPAGEEIAKISGAPAGAVIGWTGDARVTLSADKSALLVGSLPVTIGTAVQGNLTQSLSRSTNSPFSQPVSIGVVEPVTAQRIIFDSDWATDCDDVGAAAVLAARQKAGDVKVVLAVTTALIHPSYGSQAGSSMDAYFRTVLPGETVPVAAFKGNAPDLSVDGAMNDAMNQRFGTFGDQGSRLQDSTIAYRTALAAAPANSVTIVATGAVSSVAALMKSPADGISSLTGIQLVAAKVKEIVWQAGEFPSGGAVFNATLDKAASNYVVANWPTNVPFTFAGNEFGGPINSGPSTALDRRIDPTVEAYATFNNDPANLVRNSWDPAAAFYAAKGLGANTVYGGQNGTATFDLGSGANTWTPNTGGNFRYLAVGAGKADAYTAELNTAIRAAGLATPAVNPFPSLDFADVADSGAWYKPFTAANVTGTGASLVMRDLGAGARHATATATRTNGGPVPTAPTKVATGLSFDGLTNALQCNALASLFDSTTAVIPMHVFCVMEVGTGLAGENVILDFTQLDTDNHYLKRIRLRTSNNGGFVGGRVGQAPNGDTSLTSDTTGLTLIEMRIDPRITAGAGLSALCKNGNEVKVGGDPTDSYVKYPINAGRLMLSHGNGYGGLGQKGVLRELIVIPQILSGQDRAKRLRYLNGVHTLGLSN